jgi:hypothetical protein
MSTEFHASSTDEFAYLRYAGKNGVSYEFGTEKNLQDVMAAMRHRERFRPADGPDMPSDPHTSADLEALVAEGRVTTGVMPVTVELGSGEYMRFTSDL